MILKKGGIEAHYRWRKLSSFALTTTGGTGFSPNNFSPVLRALDVPRSKKRNKGIVVVMAILPSLFVPRSNCNAIIIIADQ